MHRYRLLALFCLALGVLLAAMAAPRVAAQDATTRDDVVVLTINGAITPVVARYVDRGLAEAEQTGARAVVLRMDTPGGLDTAMRAIIQRMLASRVPVITYVSPSGARAASAGAYISYAAHLAAMAPSTTIGSASPVSLGANGQEAQQSDTMTRKVTNDAVSYIRGLADRHGRNANWAERAVREAANLPASDALVQHVVDIVAVDLDDLLRQADGRTVAMDAGTMTLRTAGASIRPVPVNAPESFLQLIADPTIAYILLSLGLLGLYLEFANPGSFLPGVTGAILVLVALFALGSLPVNWAGALLMALAFGLFGVDLFAPTHGVLTLGGIIAFVLGSLLLINTRANPAFEILPAAIAAIALTLAGFSLFVSTMALRDRRRPAMTGKAGLIGATGTVRIRLAPDGMIFVQGERWSATSLSGPVEPGQPVRVLAVKGLDLVVEAVAAQPAPVRKES